MGQERKVLRESWGREKDWGEREWWGLLDRLGGDRKGGRETWGE